MICYFVINCIIFSFVYCIWTDKDFINTVIRFGAGACFIANFISLAVALGYLSATVALWFYVFLVNAVVLGVGSWTFSVNGWFNTIFKIVLFCAAWVNVLGILATRGGVQ